MEHNYTVIVFFYCIFGFIYGFAGSWIIQSDEPEVSLAKGVL